MITHGFHPTVGMDLRVTLTKIKEVAEVKHFCLPGWYYKTQKNRLVKGFDPAGIVKPSV